MHAEVNIRYVNSQKITQSNNKRKQDPINQSINQPIKQSKPNQTTNQPTQNKSVNYKLRVFSYQLITINILITGKSR